MNHLPDKHYQKAESRIAPEGLDKILVIEDRTQLCNGIILYLQTVSTIQKDRLFLTSSKRLDPLCFHDEPIRVVRNRNNDLSMPSLFLALREVPIPVSNQILTRTKEI